MSTTDRTSALVSADLTPPGGPDLAPAEGGLPGAVPNGGHPVLTVEDDFAGNGYTAAQTDPDDSEATVDPSSDQGTNADQHARPCLYIS